MRRRSGHPLRARRRLAALALILLASGQPELPARPVRQGSVALEAVPAPRPRRIALLPFTSRGAASSAWAKLEPHVAAELARQGLNQVDPSGVERFLRSRRLRDTSLLTRQETAGLAEAVGAGLILLGDIYALAEGPPPHVSLSARLIDPGRLRIVAMTVTVVDGRTLAGPLGSGGAVTLERAMQEASRSLAADLASGGEGAPRRETPWLLRLSALAPSPASYLSGRLVPDRIRCVTVLPFRNRCARLGAGQVAADIFSWCLLESGTVSLMEAGGAARRLLERGWRTGQPVGRDELLALHEEPGVDAVLMGSVDRWEEGDAAGDRAPEVSLSARLLDASSGEILWTATHERRGDQTRTIYELGNVRLGEALVARSTAEMLGPLIDTLREGSP